MTLRRRMLLVPLFLLTPTHASAQQRDTTAQLAGVVFSAYTGRPLAGATVRTLHAWTITDSLGHFALGPLPPGSQTVVFGYADQVANTLTATLERGRTLRWTVVLNVDTAATMLPAILVQAQGRATRFAQAGFYERLNRGWGAFYTPQSLQRLGAVSLRAILYEQGITLRCRLGECSVNDYSRGFACPMTVYEDGFPSSATLIDRIRASDLAGVEIYRRSVEVPFAFQAALSRLETCGGVVALWSRYLN